MRLFFILLIALVVYKYITEKSFRNTYPQLSRNQSRRIYSMPFYFAAWTLVAIIVAYTFSSLTDLFGEVFQVDNYINLFGGGWIGMILRFLRSNGFIGDIQEPMALIHYRGVIALICNVVIVPFTICILAVIAYSRLVKKPQLNFTAILGAYYCSMACGIASFLLLIWAYYGFNELINWKVKEGDDILIYLIAGFVFTLVGAIVWRNWDIKKFLAQPQCETMTWQQVLATLKIKTDKGQKTVEEWQIVCITIGLALLFSGYVILSTLPVSAEPEQVEPTNTEKQVAISPEPEEANIVSVQNDDETCMAILQKYYTASFDQIEEWGGFEIFETKRFMHYTSCWDCLVLTSNQDFGIGDECMRLERIEPNENLDHSYIVTVSCGYSGDVPTCVVMTNDEGTWKIDNISYQPYTKAYIDYSKPATDYYVYEDCVEDTTEEQEKLEENFEENENFISL